MSLTSDLLTAFNTVFGEVQASASAAATAFSNALGAITSWTNPGAWTAYTPTVTASSGTFTTVSATGSFSQLGKVVFWRAVITITTNGTAAGAVRISLPAGAATTALQVGKGREDGVSGKDLQVIFGKNSSTTADIWNYDGTYPGASGASLVMSGVYEST